MNTTNVWQQAFEKFTVLEDLTKDENNETVEYYALLKELHSYTNCMSDEFKNSYYDELDNSIAFEQEWRASMEDE